MHRKKNQLSDATNSREYLNIIIHEWLKTLSIISLTLIPLFFVLDFVIIPESPEKLLSKFASYRILSMLFILAQYLMLRYMKPSIYSYIHGYLISMNISLMISLITADLDGFNSRYYAGLNTVIIACNVLIPWQAIHSLINGVITIAIYIIVNLAIPQDYSIHILLNNLSFLVSMVIIASIISFVKYKLIKVEFDLRSEIETTRDALWGEMEIARKIQTALLPKKKKIGNFEIAYTMIPADQVGGDYFDLQETPSGKLWLGIGDVSGHGVESGLIMMMAQTSIATAIRQYENAKPSEILPIVNRVIMENIARLGIDRYMTLSLILLENSSILTAGRHNDIYIYRQKTGQIDQIKIKGTWIGVLEDIHSSNSDTTINLEKNDIILLFTDGITEARNDNNEMFGMPRLVKLFGENAHLPVDQIVEKLYNDVLQFQSKQMDDITLVILKNIS